MISFTDIDYLTLLFFFAIVFFTGLNVKSKKKNDGSDYLLGSRKLGLFAFVATTVSTWYGGILGIGEFTYRYGILSWITQGLPYYIFALLFAFLLSGKIRKTNLFTIPDKIEETYGKTASLISATIIFLLVNPAPYLLMTGSLFSLIFDFPLWLGILSSIVVIGIYLLKGGFKSTVYTDIFQFFVMFLGFILIFIILYFNYGGLNFIKANLPHSHLNPSNVSPFYITVWFFIALWTFVDPGFHQRSYAAENTYVAKYGIIISVVLWILFDFLTVSTGLYARAILGGNANAVISYPLLANLVLTNGEKGIFFAALFATILSTQNSMTFIAATTYSRDFVYRFAKRKEEINIEKHTRIGIIISSVFGFVFAVAFQSVVKMWYLFGSILIPGLIFPVIGAYYPKFKIESKFAVIEILIGTITSFVSLLVKDLLFTETSMEPMIIGLFFALAVHIYGLLIKKRKNRDATIN